MNTSVLFTEKQIQTQVKNLAQQINDSYGTSEVLAVGILRGAFVFYADLLKQLKMNLSCDFCSVSFYGAGSKASLEATLDMDIKSSVKGKQILLIDCVADQGHSLNFIKKHLEQRQPQSIKTAVLLVKPVALKNSQIDFKGFEIKQDIFVIGYGIDYNNNGRSLRYFAQLNDFN